MRMRQNFKVWVTTSILAGAVAVSANAGLTQLGIDYNTTYTGIIHDSAGSEAAYLTALRATYIAGDALPTGYPNPFTTFCMDIRYNLSQPAWWQSSSFPNPNSGTPPVWQVDGVYRAANLYNHYVGLASGANFSSPEGIKDGAALQLAIWEVLYETSGTYSVTTVDEGFWVTGADSDITGRANTFLSSAWNTIDPKITTTFWDATASNQDLLGPPVPEPATIMAGALLLLPFGASAFRIVRKHRAS